MSKPVTASSRWFVVQSNPNCELKAAANLSRAGYGPYVPVRKTERQDRRSKKWVTIERPLMTGYLFVEMPQGEWDFYSLRQCQGVKGVLGVTDARGEAMPFPVSSRLVEKVMAAQLNLTFDDTREAKARRGEAAKGQYQPGTLVIVTKGPFASFGAEVDQVRPNGTIASLINIFGRMTLIDLAADQIELAA